MSAEPLEDDLTAPRFRNVPRRDGSLVRAVEGVAAKVGRTLDGYQREAVDVLTSSWSDGRPATLESCVVAARQNIKTFAFECIALTSMTRPGGAKLVIWSAHEVATAQESFRTILDLAERYPWLGDRIVSVTRSPGREAIQFVGGRWLRFRARIKTGGRGLAGDEIFLDEAFALEPAHMGSLLPILSTRKAARVYYGSSAPLATSDILRGVMARGRAGGDGAPAYVEWSAPGSLDQPGCSDARCAHEPGSPGCVMDDERMWMMANPAAVVGRITLDYLRAERRALPPTEFARERLGWGEEAGQARAPFTMSQWERRARPDLRDTDLPRTGVTFGIDLAWDRKNGSIAAATRLPDGPPLLELVEYAHGRDALVAAASRLARANPDARWVGCGAVESIVKDLRAAGVGVRLLKPAEVEQACGALQDAVVEGPFAHLGDPVVRAALEAAERRDTENGWVWARRRSADQGVDISPLYAFTTAHGALPPDIDLMDTFG